jgi:hypothetical protein
MNTYRFAFVIVLALLILSLAHNVTAQDTVNHGNMIIDISKDLCRDAAGTPVSLTYNDVNDVSDHYIYYIAANGDYVRVKWAWQLGGGIAKTFVHVKADACRKSQ